MCVYLGELCCSVEISTQFTGEIVYILYQCCKL